MLYYDLINKKDGVDYRERKNMVQKNVYEKDSKGVLNL